MFVFTQSNSADGNQLLSCRRDDDGRLTVLTPVSTKGAGSGTAHLPSQGSVILTDDRQHVFVTNAGSGDVAVFAVRPDGPELLQTVDTGTAPRSVAERNGTVYVLATGDPAIHVFRWDGAALAPIAGGPCTLPDDVDAAQIGFGPGGRLVVTSRGRDELLAFPVLDSGLLGDPVATPSAGPTPYGFATTSQGIVVVTEAFRAQKGAAAASSYRLDGDRLTPVTASAGNGRSEICWAVTTPNGRYAFTTNFADGAISRWRIDADGSLVLEDATAGLTQDGRSGLRDEDLTDDGRFLYAIDADAGELRGWAVDGVGVLTPIATAAGLPATVAGLAAF
ncbi:MAG TPA: beta-propeller fold lactonase family protein [Kineosporiaceae bacterium]|nr:beta-propeller fold lactonase family protein [Kineosporiaceae bacterium]